MLWEHWHVCPDGVLTKIMAEHLHFEMRGLLTGKVRVKPDTKTLERADG